MSECCIQLSGSYSNVLWTKRASNRMRRCLPETGCPMSSFWQRLSKTDLTFREVFVTCAALQPPAHSTAVLFCRGQHADCLVLGPGRGVGSFQQQCVVPNGSPHLPAHLSPHSKGVWCIHWKWFEILRWEEVYKHGMIPTVLLFCLPSASEKNCSIRARGFS